MYKVTVWDGENTATYIINERAIYAITAEASRLNYTSFGSYAIIAEANRLHYIAFGKFGIKFTTKKF